MKKVFFDTNVILEYILQREHWIDAKIVVEWLVKNKVQMMMSVGGFYTMHYLIDKYLRQELGCEKSVRITMLRKLLTNILQTFVVAQHDNASLLQGTGDIRFSDIEDSCQYQLANNSACDMLVTFNLKDYPQTSNNSAVPVINPQQFIDTYICNNV